MNSVFGKVIGLTLFIFVLMYGFKIYQQNKERQELLVKEISGLKEHVIEQEKTFEAAKKANQIAQNKIRKQQKIEADKQAQILEKQVQETQKQSVMIEEQIETMQDVVDDLKDQQESEKRMIEEQQAAQQNNIRASYMSTGLMTASSLKVYIAEYYIAEGKFPNSNKALNLPKPRQYASDAVHSITISTGGKITIVYNEKSGQDKGAINLKPSYKNDQIVWKCSTRDYNNIHQFMPQCRYGS